MTTILTIPPLLIMLMMINRAYIKAYKYDCETLRTHSITGRQTTLPAKAMSCQQYQGAACRTRHSWMGQGGCVGTWTAQNGASNFFYSILHANAHSAAQKDEIEEGPMSLSLQGPLLKELLSAIDTLYNLALSHSQEPEFSNLFHTLLDVQSLLKAKQQNVLKSSKITAYFQNMEIQKKEAADSKTDGGEVILVNWVTFCACPLTVLVICTYLHFVVIVLYYNMSKVIFFLFYKHLRCNKAVTCPLVYLSKVLWFDVYWPYTFRQVSLYGEVTECLSTTIHVIKCRDYHLQVKGQEQAEHIVIW